MDIIGVPISYIFGTTVAGTWPFAGRGADNIAALLEGQDGHITPPWEIDKQGSVWWKIRNHANHFELIRSCYIKARR